MTQHTTPSKLSFRLYLVAAFLMLIQTVILFIVVDIMEVNLPIFSWVAGILALLFFIGAFFAKTGLGTTSTTREYTGGGWYRERVESANAITCGCMTGLAVLIISIAMISIGMEDLGSVVIIGAAPSILSGIVAMVAGLVSIRSTRRSSLQNMASKTCPYCRMRGIDSSARVCPNCGTPL